MNRFRFLILGVVAVSILAGCQSNLPIYNVVEHNLPEVVGKLSMEKAEQVFITSASKRGWVFNRTGPGELEGTLALRAHTASVSGRLQRYSFSIHYLSSTNLNADGVNIHKNYNHWIRNLEQDVADGLILAANLMD